MSTTKSRFASLALLLIGLCLAQQGLAAETTNTMGAAIVDGGMPPSLPPIASPSAIESLFGNYRYKSCQNNGQPVWGVNPQEFYLTISNDPFKTGRATPDYLGLLAYRSEDSPLRLNWDMQGINRGPLHTLDRVSGNTIRTEVTYTTEDGVFSSLKWNYPESAGWSSVQIKKTPSGIEYRMMKQYLTPEQSPVSDEICILERI